MPWTTCPHPHLSGLQDKPLLVAEITTHQDLTMCIKYIHVHHCCGAELQCSITFWDDMENCGGVYTSEIDGGLYSICQNLDTDMFEEDGQDFFDQVRIIQILLPIHLIKLNSWKIIANSLAVWIRKFKLKACRSQIAVVHCMAQITCLTSRLVHVWAPQICSVVHWTAEIVNQIRLQILSPLRREWTDNGCCWMDRSVGGDAEWHWRENRNTCHQWPKQIE